MNLDEPLNHYPSSKSVSPILGHRCCYSAVRSQVENQMLVLVFIDNEWQVWKTRRGAKSFVEEDNSIDYLATVLPGPLYMHSDAWQQSNAGYIQYIDGDLYATVTARTTGTPGWTYSRVMRDSSPNSDGSGPWVLHGRLPTDGPRDVPDDAVFQNSLAGFGGCEIVTAGNRWATVCPVWGNVEDFWAGQNTEGFSNVQRMGAAHSDNRGLTWTLDLNVGFYLIGGIYGISGSRQIAKWDGYWYIGGKGNVSEGAHFRSPNLANWTSIGPLDGGINSNGRTFPIADPESLWSLKGWRGPGLSNSLERDTFSYTHQSGSPTPSTDWTEVDLFRDLTNRVDETDPTIVAVDEESGLYAAVGTQKVRALFPLKYRPIRQYPRDDGLGHSSSPRMYPTPKVNRVFSKYI